MSSRVELFQAGPENQRSLENLIELYIHDFSEFVSVDVGEDGRFGYPDLPLIGMNLAMYRFWQKLKASYQDLPLSLEAGMWGDSEVWDMAEFFVLQRYRHRGVGAEMAEKVSYRCPGKWQIRVRSNNLPARSFWESAIAKFTRKPVSSQDFQIEEVEWNLFSFQCGDQ